MTTMTFFARAVVMASAIQAPAAPPLRLAFEKEVRYTVIKEL